MSLKLGVSGFVTLDIIEAKTNKIIEHWEDHNDIVPYGFLELLYSISAPWAQDGSDGRDRNFRINQIVFGSNGSPNASPDGEPGYNTDITIANRFAKLLDEFFPEGTPGQRYNIAGYSWNYCVMSHKFSLSPSENNGQTIRELALEIEDFNTSGISPNKVIARVVRAPIAKTSAIRIEGTWTWTFTLG